MPDELAFGWQQFPHAQAINVYARGLGAGRSGDAAAARVAIAELTRLKQGMLDGGLRYWADQTDIQIKVVDAWALRVEGKPEDALRMMRSAADHEDATDKAAVTPGPIKPAREMLGEMLLEAKQPSAALVEFEIAMTKEPGRLHAALGAARAAAAAGDRTRARSHYVQVAKLMERADAGHPELAQVKTALAQ
jgi:Flp pilus assembly protein TadD